MSDMWEGVETVQGRRVDGVGTLSMMPGDYKLTTSGAVWFVTPTGRIGHVTPGIWTITVHEDESITIMPSIRVFLPAQDDPPCAEQILYHGYLQRGVWSACNDSP